MVTEPGEAAADLRKPARGPGATLADQMRSHARRDRHLYAVLMRAMADDWEAGGPVRDICRGWEQPRPDAAVHLRLLAGLFRIVLTGRAPELFEFYPCLGGHTPADDAWPSVREVLRANVVELHDALAVGPQTNEVGRSTALLVGLFDVVRRSGRSRVRLLEPGASAGLNLLVDQFRFVNQTWSFGPESSRLVLEDGVVGQLDPAPFEIVARRGCDLHPVDPMSDEGGVRLRSFVWPFDVERHRRLSAALEIVARFPVAVDAAAAGEWLEDRLAADVPDDVLTVVWQSITQMYWPDEEIARVRTAVAAAMRCTAVAHVSMEYPDLADSAEIADRGAAPAELVVTGPSESPRRRFGTVGDHGIPVTLSGQRDLSAS